jgi:hypothetical protein
MRAQHPGYKAWYFLNSGKRVEAYLMIFQLGRDHESTAVYSTYPVADYILLDPFQVLGSLLVFHPGMN